jgi:peroxiredoxin
VSQLGELARIAPELQRAADVYVINPDTPENSRKLRAQIGITVPILLDPDYSGAKRYDLAGQGRPMGGLVGYAVIDAAGIIRVQRVDIDFGAHSAQFLDAVQALR